MDKMSASESVVSQIVFYVSKHPESEIRMRQGLAAFSNSIDFFQADADEMVTSLINLKPKQLNIIYSYISGDISEKMFRKKTSPFNVSKVFKKKNGVRKDEKLPTESYNAKSVFEESPDGELPYLLQE